MLKVTVTYWHGNESVKREHYCREVFVDSDGNLYGDNRKIRSQSGYYDGFPVADIRVHNVEKD